MSTRDEEDGRDEEKVLRRVYMDEIVQGCPICADLLLPLKNPARHSSGCTTRLLVLCYGLSIYAS